MLKITDIQITPFEEKGKVVGFAKVTFNEDLCVGSVKIINGTNGLFVGFPSMKKKDSKEYYDIVYPTSKEARKRISDEIIDAFKSKQGNDDSNDAPF